MSSLEFWLTYGLGIFFGGLLLIMIFVSIVMVEYRLLKKRKKR